MVHLGGQTNQSLNLQVFANCLGPEVLSADMIDFKLLQHVLIKKEKRIRQGSSISSVLALNS